MMQELLNRAERGEHVFLPDVRAAFSAGTSRIQCVLELVIGFVLLVGQYDMLATTIGTLRIARDEF